MVSDVFNIVGTCLSGTFQVEGVVAEGGFGVVYRAEHIAFRAPVALKCLKIPGAMTPEQREAFVESFREEAEMLFHLSGQIPEVVRPLHADAIALPDGNFMPYIAMEWIEGMPLDSIVIQREERHDKPLQLRPLIKMLTPIAHALQRAHFFEVPGGGVVSVAHCDLKPENILIVEQGPIGAKILDFGIAKARELVQDSFRKTDPDAGSSPFTPSYGAPEQWVPKRFGGTGPWTDVWGLALTMVECLTGKPPIDGDMAAMMGTALDENRRPTPRREGADIPERVDAVFARALAVNPRDRYQQIEAFWTELERSFGVASSFARASKARAAADASGPNAAVRDDARDLDDPLGPGQSAGSDGDAADGSELELELESGSPSGYDLAAEARPSAPAANAAGFASPAHSPSGSENRIDLDGAQRNSAAGAKPRPTPSGGARASQAGPPPSPALRPRPAAASRARVAVAETPNTSLVAPIAMIVIGLGLGALDMILSQSMGSPLALGPLRLRWIGALVAGVGIVLALAGLAGKDAE